MPSWDVNESFGVRRDGGLLRVHRSTDGRRVVWFHPDWRRRQALIYRNAASAHDGDRAFTLPSWEDDDLVINYFMYCTRGRCNTPVWTELISGAVQCDETNDYHGMGTRIKAFTIAEWSTEDISEMVGLDVEVVDTYLKIFFDVRGIMHNRERIASIVFPFGPTLKQKMSPSEQREQIWIATAFSGDHDLLEFFTQNRLDMSHEEMEKNFERIVALTAGQALEYGVAIRSEGLPRAAHFTNFVALQDVSAKLMNAKAMKEGMNQNSKATEQLSKWENLLGKIGLRQAVGREIGANSLVTNLSISELRAGGGDKALGDREQQIRGMIVDVETGVGVKSFEDEE